MTAKTPLGEEYIATIKKAQDQIKRLTVVAHKLASERDALTKERDALTKERDELAEDNVKLQIETMEWQNEWYKMKVALKNARKRMMYPKRSQRIKENLKRKNLKRTK